jgi:hypothetical protein
MRLHSAVLNNGSAVKTSNSLAVFLHLVCLIVLGIVCCVWVISVVFSVWYTYPRGYAEASDGLCKTGEKVLSFINTE